MKIDSHLYLFKNKDQNKEWGFANDLLIVFMSFMFA